VYRTFHEKEISLSDVVTDADLVTENLLITRNGSDDGLTQVAAGLATWTNMQDCTLNPSPQKARELTYSAHAGNVACMVNVGYIDIYNTRSIRMRRRQSIRSSSGVLVDQQRGNPARFDILFHYQALKPNQPWKSAQSARSRALCALHSKEHIRLGPSPITPSNPPSTPRSSTIAPSTSLVSRSFKSTLPSVSLNFASDPTLDAALAGEMFRFFFLPFPLEPDCRGSGAGTDKVISSVYAGACVCG